MFILVESEETSPEAEENAFLCLSRLLSIMFSIG